MARALGMCHSHVLSFPKPCLHFHSLWPSGAVDSRIRFVAGVLWEFLSTRPQVSPHTCIHRTCMCTWGQGMTMLLRPACGTHINGLYSPSCTRSSQMLAWLQNTHRSLGGSRHTTRCWRLGSGGPQRGTLYGRMLSALWRLASCSVHLWFSDLRPCSMRPVLTCEVAQLQVTEHSPMPWTVVLKPFIRWI